MVASLSCCYPAFAQLETQYRNQKDDAERQRQSYECLCQQIIQNAQYKNQNPQYEGAGGMILGGEINSYWMVDNSNKIFAAPGNLGTGIPQVKKCGYVATVGVEFYWNSFNDKACIPNRKISVTQGGVIGMAQAFSQACYLTKYTIEQNVLVVYTQLSRGQGGNGEVNRSVLTNTKR
ncbi:MAG: hypothetical protein WCK64_07280 [Synechococcaceae cyanobacterium ELA445]